MQVFLRQAGGFGCLKAGGARNLGLLAGVGKRAVHFLKETGAGLLCCLLIFQLAQDAALAAEVVEIVKGDGGIAGVEGDQGAGGQALDVAFAV